MMGEGTEVCGLHGDLLPASSRYGVGGGKSSVYTGGGSVLALLNGDAGGYLPSLNGQNASGVCAGGGGGKQTSSANTGGSGAPGFVRIRY